MNEEDRVLLHELQKTVDENQKILKGIRSHHRFATLFKVLYWMVIAAVVFGAYYITKPVIDSVGSTIDKTKQAAETINNSSKKGSDAIKEITDRLPEVKFLGNILEKKDQ